MVGQLYPKGDGRLDSAFTIFYMGINVGAFLGMLICPLLGDVKVDNVRVVSAFKWGFLAAGAAMLIGSIVFLLLKDKYVVKPDGSPIGAKPSFNKPLDLNGRGRQSEIYTCRYRWRTFDADGSTVLRYSLSFYRPRCSSTEPHQSMDLSIHLCCGYQSRRIDPHR